ncbi:aromatic-ring-hydroxylating dioxygenase subunit beta [Bacillus sp. Marseille-P3661]|uniref:aromatic-ring-hydroxylating dioxygenase subunit beta n=1 Tax=Bacillus sp. Marseille-P3661 TaxID=1936234 RepID=UPI000C844D00|nr:aromatic-ring-hydroxylating dioxygenase subunit beta [Bacillus sp. Marseille-P3661]
MNILDSTANDLMMFYEIYNFITYEAELLDDARYQEWFQLFTEDIKYQIPVRTTRYKKDGDGISNKMFHVDDDYHILDKRVRRIQSKSAWSENPPSRTRHVISNIRFISSEKDNEYLVKSNFILYRNRGDIPAYDIISGERQDVLRKLDGNLKIAYRKVLIDQSNLSMHNLGVFL